MKRFNFNNKPLVESPYPPQNTNVLWIDVDESTGKVSSISKFNNGTWKIILLQLTGDLYKIYVIRKKDISNCTYNMVDLGFPSGLKWADRNVGATIPEHYGSYFQWGDTNAYTFDGVGEITAAQLVAWFQPLVGDAMEITEDNIGDLLGMFFEGYNGDNDLTNIPMGAFGYSFDKCFNSDTYFDTTDGGSTFNKYNTNGGLIVLESIDDAATAHMGSQYRMPTKTELDELVGNTTQVFIDFDGNEYSQEETINGAIASGRLKGVRFTGSNGNSIFIPAAGTCLDYMYSQSGGCCLLSSCLYSDSLCYGINIAYYGSILTHNVNRDFGLSVRGVQS